MWLEPNSARDKEQCTKCHPEPRDNVRVDLRNLTSASYMVGETYALDWGMTFTVTRDSRDVVAILNATTTGLNSNTLRRDLPSGPYRLPNCQFYKYTAIAPTVLHFVSGCFCEPLQHRGL